MKLVKNLIIYFFIIIVFDVNAITDKYCTPEAAKQVAKIVYREVGGELKNKENDAFEKLTTAAIVVNNASGKKGSTFYKKLMNLGNNNYANYSSYKNRSFNSVISKKSRAKFLYIARLVLTGEYSVPKQMNLQATKSIVTKYGKVWDYVPTNRLTVYFGHSHKLTKTNFYGEKLESTSSKYYRKLAKKLMDKDYSHITVDNVCDISLTNNENFDNTINNIVENTPVDRNAKEEMTFAFCETPSVLKVFYFIKVIIYIIKVLVPVILIIIGMITLSRAFIANDEMMIKSSTKNVVVKIILGLAIFLLPTLISSLLISFGNMQDNLNFTDCLENATKEQIAKFEEIIENQ